MATEITEFGNLNPSCFMRPQIKVQLKTNKIFFDTNTMKLLRLIDSCGSVKEACDKANISYSKAWSMIHTAEKELGYEIVLRKQGGKFGGQARITAKGHWLMEQFHMYETEVSKNAEILYKEYFKNSIDHEDSSG